jgi:GT2 family glycosyltransferase
VEDAGNRQRVVAAATQPVSTATDSASRALAVSVIIPVHKDSDAFRRCLASVAGLSPEPLEVIVAVDGGDASASQAAAQAGFAVVALAERGGPARARNAAARRACGDILFFLDADVAVGADAIARVAREFEARPALSALFGSYDDAPAETNFLSQYRNLLHHYVHQTSREDASTFWAACGAIRRDVFLAAGGFDEGFTRPSIEDIELGYRVRSAGGTIALVKSLQVKHLKRWTAFSMIRTDVLDRALPWTKLLLERSRFEKDLNLTSESRLSVAAACVLAASLAGAAWQPWLAAAAFASAVTLAAANAGFYRFLIGKRGPVFTVKAAFWHWIFYIYGGLAFAAGLARHLSARPLRPATHAAIGAGGQLDTRGG